MIPEILNIELPSYVMERNPESADFNKTTLQEANQQLQTTTSDKSSFTSDAGTRAKQNGNKTAVDMDTWRHQSKRF